MADKMMVVLALAACVVVVAAAAARAGQDYVWGESDAWVSADAGFEGYWKYSMSISWNVSEYSDPAHAASHVSILLGLDNCLDVCEEGYFTHPDTVGTSQGEGACTVYYYLEFDCAGDPTVPDPVPTIKFEPYPSYCEPDITGTASVSFYCIAPPDTESIAPAYVWIKFGQYIEKGTIEGVLPMCVDVPVSTETSAWGAIKSLFR